jgi:hypothetical protein
MLLDHTSRPSIIRLATRPEVHTPAHRGVPQGGARRVAGLVIFGSLVGLTILGHKRDECAKCGAIGTHVVVRRTYWFHVFWAPVLLVWVRHGMICDACGEWTGLSWRQVRRAMKTGVMQLERARPVFTATRSSLADDFGRLPNVVQHFDPFVVNPKRGFWDIYLKLWLGAVIAIVAFFTLAIIFT